MAYFAVLEDDKVINVIVADSQEDATIVTGKTCVEDTEGYASIGGTYDGKKFWQVQPFASWVKNEDKGLWEAPVPRPTDGNPYYWDEPTLSWIQLPAEPGLSV